MKKLVFFVLLVSSQNIFAVDLHKDNGTFNPESIKTEVETQEIELADMSYGTFKNKDEGRKIASEVLKIFTPEVHVTELTGTFN